MFDAMNIIRNLIVLLCMCLTFSQLHAQENLDLKGTSCVPVMAVTEDALAFKAGERMDFVLQYGCRLCHSYPGLPDL